LTHTGAFSTLLVANRGEIARRIFRTARAMGLRCVAVYVEADTDAPFVKEADEAVRLHDGGYLDGAAIVEAAHLSGADAIHPGYGFLSESAVFAAAVQAAELVWIGPPVAVVEAMGDKLAAKRAAVAAGVPTLPSSVDPADDTAIGYPMLVKAAAGGGGKGMRIVQSAEHLGEAVAAARREAVSSFGDDRVFLERYVPRSRHVEIQILGDAYAAVVHLGERECSIQRRHQKIIEESPSPYVDGAMRAAMGDAALRLAGAIGYQSAGTVEFLVDDATGEFYFLEVNTRLQVEHAVTEEVTGIDLVREQLRLAAGEPLGFAQADITFKGHAVEARLYAEDPGAGFLPATGTLAAFAPAAEPNLRWDSGVEAGTVVGVQFDPMLAKVVAHAPTRVEAASRLALGLERLHLAGVTTNCHFLASTLRDPAFLAGDTTTDFIERIAPATDLELSDDDLERAFVVGALWLQGRNRAEATELADLPSGWRNGRLPAQRVSLAALGRDRDVEYSARRDGSFVIGHDRRSTAHSARVHDWKRTSVDVEIDRRRSVHRVTAVDGHIYVQMPRGTLDIVVAPLFVRSSSDGPTGGLAASMPGVVLEVRVAVADEVERGQTLVVLEAMKMEHHMKALADGIVAEVRVVPGQHVENGTLLLVLEPAGSPGMADGVPLDRSTAT
jgi:propionyl-CoA carboxylase alpha chain